MTTFAMTHVDDGVRSEVGHREIHETHRPSVQRKNSLTDLDERGYSGAGPMAPRTAKKARNDQRGTHTLHPSIRHMHPSVCPQLKP